ncbi:uncharacterized protein LOC6049165 [Culex quinquefasciatus]|uniref:uncharacterized protein LOC6049165 n=2 Tax=Culex quinquefasciatus TaxID=7176 RepID=UPI0018E3F6F8|nr:uncharacterized protein LOC6049165 [Culex quinquefasciatus]
MTRYPRGICAKNQVNPANSQSLLRSPVMDTALGSLVMEIGYTLTASLEDCKNHLPKIGDRKNTAQDVAKIISSMCLTHASLSESPVVHALGTAAAQSARTSSLLNPELPAKLSLSEVETIGKNPTDSGEYTLNEPQIH